jgi:hypothetical protein
VFIIKLFFKVLDIQDQPLIGPKRCAFGYFLRLNRAGVGRTFGRINMDFVDARNGVGFKRFGGGGNFIVYF